jgi:2-hydroxy-6-oxonona-2,4-dienedioate hydrolase
MLRTVAWLLGFLLAGFLVVVTVAYQRDIRRARRRIAIGSQVIETPCGPIEYAVAGEGQPVLIVHGAGGGFDQGMDLAAGLLERGFRIIAVSRFGYLRTPVPHDASAEAQADAYACLLDALNLPRAAVLGASAGGPSSLQFAIRHPDRISALVLMVPAAYPFQAEQRPNGALPDRVSSQTRFLFDTALRSDFLFWVMRHLAPRTFLRALVGTPPELLAQASPEARARVAMVMDHILPVSSRRLGLLNDGSIVPVLPRYELERISAPTLILGVQDDLYRTWPGARYSAEHIPQARFVGYATGGHLFVGHDGEAAAEITAFLQSHIAVGISPSSWTSPTGRGNQASRSSK